MSSLTGHAQITATAVRELASEWRVNPVVAGLSEADLVVATVGRDILDVLIIGHWADFGQKHHFMRQFDQQSPYDAYESAVEWIRTNALQSARELQQNAGIPAHHTGTRYGRDSDEMYVNSHDPGEC